MFFSPYDWLLDRILIHMKYFVTSYPVEIEGARSFAWCISLVPSREQRKIRKNPRTVKKQWLTIFVKWKYIYIWMLCFLNLFDVRCVVKLKAPSACYIGLTATLHLRWSTPTKSQNNMELQNEGLVDDARKSSMCSLCHLKECFSAQLRGSVTGEPGSLMKITGYPPMPC